MPGALPIDVEYDIQAVFQDPFAVFNPFYTVDHLLTVPIKKFRLAKNKTEATDKMVEALTAVGLHPQDILGRFPHQLSGGQRQRVTIARALVNKPAIVWADEPTGDLDRETADDILELLRLLNAEHGKTIIMVTHDPRAAESAGRIVQLDKGALVEQE